jgi:hypothetical protein
VAERPARRPSDLAVLGGALAFFFLLHPAPGILWFDFPWIAYNLLPLPLSLEGMSEAIRWQVTVHTPSFVRPVRAVQWWLAVRAFGCDAFGYYVVNVLGLAVMVWAAWRVAARVTGSRVRALLVAGCLAVSYATVYSLLFFGFSLVAACGLAGLALYFGAEDTEPRRRGRRLAAALGLLLVAGLSHETLLALAPVPLAHAAIVRRDRRAVLRALVFLAILPVFAVWRLVLTSIYGGSPQTLADLWHAARETPGVLVENPARVLFALATGGMPLDPLRALPIFPEFARIRELMPSPAGALALVLALAPAALLVALALRASRGDGAARRRVGFCLVWLALGSLPLMLPVGTPESFHLTGALPALFLLWTEALGRSERLGAGTRAVAWTALVVWLGLHASARWVVFHRDVPAMTASERALHGVLARAQLEGANANVLFFPAQIGAHYGMMPTVAALFPAADGAAGACLRGARIHGCLVEPTWVWSALRPWPPLPGACRAPEGIRVGPLDAATERELAGSRRMLSHASVTLTKQTDPRILGTCALPPAEPRVVDGRRYALYPASAGTRWYRFSFEPRPAVLPLSACDAAAGR